MLRLGCLVLAGVCALPAVVVPAVAAPRGRVIRIERTRGAASTPRVCDIRADRTGTCLGSEPAAGELVTVLDEDGVIAEVRIVDAVPFSTGGSTECQSLWNVKTEVMRGDLSSIPMRAIGVVDREIHPRRGRNLPKDQFPAPPSGRSDEQVVVAVDRDGDQTADIVLTQATCEGGGGGGGGGGGACIDQYARVGGRMVRVQQTNFAACGL